MRCRGLHEVAKPAYLEGLICSGLLSVAPYCVLGGIRVVSSEAQLLHDSARPRHSPEGRHTWPDKLQFNLTSTATPTRCPQMGRNTADGIDEALG